jgi:zinc transport system substrate-binding protein
MANGWSGAVLCIICIGTLAVVTGCTDSAPSGPADGRIVIGVSILPQAEFVESVGGDHVEVIVMVPPGASPATYEPTPGQLVSLADARIYVQAGSSLPFEMAYLSRLSESNPEMLVVNSSVGIKVVGNDPHIWISPQNVIIMTGHITEGLCLVDPSNCDEYRDNAQLYIEELEKLDAEIREEFAYSSTTSFMVHHASWGYFAREYGLEQIAIEQEGKEPSARELEALIRTAQEQNITVIFASPQMSTVSPNTIAEQIGARVICIDPLARNYTENLRSVARLIAGSGASQ